MYTKLKEAFYLAFMKAIKETGDDYKKLSWLNKNKLSKVR